MMRFLVVVVVVVVSAGLPWIEASGQQVTVRLVDPDGRAAGAIVSAVRGEEILVRKLADELGVADVRVPGPGVYRFRVDRIGRIAFTSDTFTVAAGGRVLRLTLPTAPVLLPDVVAQGIYLCAEARASKGRAYALWEEARKALLGSSIARGFHTVYEQRLFTKRISLSGMVLRRTYETRHSTAARPFLTHAPDRLHVDGYVRPGPEGGYTFLAPDEDVLLSELFLETHCFGIVHGTEDRVGMVGLTFRPVQYRETPDLAGTIWLDQKTGFLRDVVFSYTGLPEEVDFSSVGGRVAFARRSTGVWFVSAWSIKTPIVVRSAQTDLGPVGRRFAVVGYLEEGGEARPAPRSAPSGCRSSGCRNVPINGSP